MKVPALFAAALMILAACGSDSGDSGEVAADDDDGDGASISDADLTPSPIGNLLGFDYTDPEASRQQFEEDEQRRQEAVAACMTELGFEYVAWVDPQMFSASTGPDGLEWGSRAWTEKYGYGVTTQWFSQDTVGPDLVGYDWDEPDTGSADPNLAIVEALPESERAAYEAALWGDPDDAPQYDESMSEEEMEAAWADYEPSGCYSEADSTGDQAAINDFYEEHSDDMNELYEAALADPRIVEYQAGIESCVTEQGIDYVSGDDYWQELSPELEALQAEVTMPEGGIAMEEAGDGATDVTIGPGGSEDLSDAGKARLAELQAAEVELAIAAFDCGGDQVSMAELYSEVQAELEQAWLDEHPEVVSQLGEAG